MNITYHIAQLADIEGILALQLRYHVDTISPEDREEGFVTTLFTKEQLAKLIEEEQGIMIAKDGDKVVSYAMNGSWDYWSAWPLFQYMIEDLPGTTYRGVALTTTNTYQYGPVCVDKAYRKRKIFQNILEFSRRHFGYRYPIMLTFVNAANEHSKFAHIDGAGLELIKTFPFNGQTYLELGFDNREEIKGHQLDGKCD